MTEQNLELELTKAQLKVQALLESIAELNNKNSEYRVEVTMLSGEIQRLYTENQELKSASEEVPDEPVEPQAGPDATATE